MNTPAIAAFTHQPASTLAGNNWPSNARNKGRPAAA